MTDIRAIEYRELIDSIIDDIIADYPKSGTLSEMLEITEQAVNKAIGRFSSPAELFTRFPSTFAFRIANSTMFEIDGPDTIGEALNRLAVDALESSVSYAADDLLWKSFPEGVYKAARGVLDVAIRFHNRGLSGLVTKQDIKDTRDLYVSDGIVGPEFWSITRMVMNVNMELLDGNQIDIAQTVVDEVVEKLGGETAVQASLDDTKKLIHLISAQESRFQAQLKNAWAEFDPAIELHQRHARG